MRNIENQKKKKFKKKGKVKRKQSSEEESNENSEKEEDTKKKKSKKSKKSNSDEESEKDDEIRKTKKKPKKKVKKFKNENNEEDNNEKTNDTDLLAAPLQISNLTPNPNNDNLDYLTYDKLIKLIGEYLKIFFKYGSFFPEFMKNQNANIIKKFISKYNMFFNIKRFAIPCFGTISCGKSTFINYLLKLHNILEADEDIATKFVCCIRHVKDLKKPKIYSVKFEQRDLGKFNFEKDKPLKGDVKEIIKERNKFIKEGKGKREPSNYFLIVEVDIPLFHGENEKYSPYFEFLDFPGLDEVKTGENTIVENTYFKDFLPLVQPNIMFSLFLFDLNSYESNSGKDILKNYISNIDDKGEYMNLKLKQSLYRSIYILNQIDKELKLIKDPQKREEAKEKRENHFRLKMKENFEVILKIKDLNFNETNSISLSAKILELNEYKFESFPQFLLYINSLEELEEEKNYKTYLEKKIKETFNISKIDKKKYKIPDDEEDEIEEELEEELENVNDNLSNINLVGNNFKMGDYYSYKKIFETNLEVYNKDDYKDDIQCLIMNQIKNSFDEFFNLEEFSTILTYIENNSKDLLEYSKKMEKNMIALNENPNSIEYPLTLFEKISKQIKKFLSISTKSNTIMTLESDSKDIFDYVTKQLSMRFIFIGRHNSGKTSLINSFLGIDLLQTSAQECTMAGFIIKHIENLFETTIYEGKMEKNKFGYYYFEKVTPLAKGVENVKEKINHLNEKENKNKNENEKELKFYIIEVPINIFKQLEISEEIYSKIELIDIPGLDTGFSEAINSSNNLLGFTDGFVFVNNGKQLDNNDNRVIIKNIIERISKRPQFSFNTCLFVLTRADECKINLKETKEQIQKILSEGFEMKSFAQIIRDKKAIQNKNNLLVSPFSNILYKDYIILIKELENYEFLEKDLNKVKNNLMNNYMEIEESEFDEYKQTIQIDENDEKYKKITSILKDNYKFTDDKILKNKQKIIDIVYISSFILKFNKNIVKYIGSHAEKLFQTFKIQINNANNIYQSNLKMMCVNFFFNNLTPLAILKSSINKTNSININTLNDKKETEKKLLIKEIHLNYLKKIEEFFNDLEEMVNSKIENKLKPAIKDKKFKTKMAEVDTDIKLYLKDMYSHINKKIEELNKELKELMDNILKDLECDLNPQKFSAIQDMASGYLGIGIASGGILAGGITMGLGIGYASSALIAIQTGLAASIGIPVVGIVIGALGILGSAGYLIYRLVRDESKVNDELIKKFSEKNKQEIDKSLKAIKKYIQEIIDNAEKKIEFFYSISKEDLTEFRKNKDLFEKYYIEYENIIIEGFNL